VTVQQTDSKRRYIAAEAAGHVYWQLDELDRVVSSEQPCSPPCSTPTEFIENTLENTEGK